MSHCGNSEDLGGTINGTRFTMDSIGKSIGKESWDQIESHFYAWAVSGVFAWAAIIISVHLIIQHCRNYYKPMHQRHITRILCMVPIYSITAWLTFRYFQYVVYLEFIRGLFESLVIYEFFTLLIRYLGESEEEQQRVLKSKPVKKLAYPLCCFTCNPASTHFVNDCKILVIQYAVVRQITTIVGIVMEMYGVYCPESMSYRHGRIYVLLINIGSTAVAMYGLVTLYLTIRKDIQEYKPISKFLAVKFVLFLSFWQSIIIALLSHYNYIPHSAYWSHDNVTTGLQSFLVCVEMFIAALLHRRNSCFGYQDFVTGHHDHPTNVAASLRDAFDPTETLKEWGLGFAHLFTRCLKTTRKKQFHDEDMIPLHQ